MGVILPVSQFKKIAKEWQLEYEIEEGDMITTTAKRTRLHRNLIVAVCRYREPFEVLHATEESNHALGQDHPGHFALEHEISRRSPASLPSSSSEHSHHSDARPALMGELGHLQQLARSQSAGKSASLKRKRNSIRKEADKSTDTNGAERQVGRSYGESTYIRSHTHEIEPFRPTGAINPAGLSNEVYQDESEFQCAEDSADAFSALSFMINENFESTTEEERDRFLR